MSAFSHGFEPAGPGRLLRRLVLAIIAGACVALGGALLWAWLDPASLGASRATHLLALLGLFTLPSATMSLWLLDERRRPAPPKSGPHDVAPRHRHAARRRTPHAAPGRRPRVRRHHLH